MPQFTHLLNSDSRLKDRSKLFIVSCSFLESECLFQGTKDNDSSLCLISGRLITSLCQLQLVSLCVHCALPFTVYFSWHYDECEFFFLLHKPKHAVRFGLLLFPVSLQSQFMSEGGPVNQTMSTPKNPKLNRPHMYILHRENDRLFN